MIYIIRKLKEKIKLRKEQKELVKFFLDEYSIEVLLAESIFSNSPYEIEIIGKLSEDVIDAVQDLGYGKLIRKENSHATFVFKANPKKFNYEKFKDYKIAYEYIVKEVEKTIDMSIKCGRHDVHQYISSIPHFDVGCFLAIEDRLQLDYPSLQFDIEIAFALATDSLLVSGSC